MAEEPKPTTAQPAPHAEFRDLIRIAEKDIKGGISTLMALTKVKGCDFMMANAVCNALNLDRTLKCGSLTQEQIAKIEDALKHPTKYGIPAWMLNHRKELETGVDKHLVASDLRLQNEMDIRYLKRIKVYRGIRHARGSKKVRGQHTGSTGRRGGTLGVIRKKEAPKAAPKKEEKK